MSVKNFPNGVRLVPQADPPSNPREGQLYYDNGDNRNEGPYVYKNGSWLPLDVNVASSNDANIRSAYFDSNFTMQPTDEIIYTRAGSTFTLLNPSDYPGREITIVTEGDGFDIKIFGNAVVVFDSSDFSFTKSSGLLNKYITLKSVPGLNYGFGGNTDCQWVVLNPTNKKLNTRTVTVPITTTTANVGDLAFTSVLSSGKQYKAELTYEVEVGTSSHCYIDILNGSTVLRSTYLRNNTSGTAGGSTIFSATVVVSPFEITNSSITVRFTVPVGSAILRTGTKLEVYQLASMGSVDL